MPRKSGPVAGIQGGGKGGRGKVSSGRMMAEQGGGRRTIKGAEQAYVDGTDISLLDELVPGAIEVLRVALDLEQPVPYDMRLRASRLVLAYKFGLPTKRVEHTHKHAHVMGTLEQFERSMHERAQAMTAKALPEPSPNGTHNGTANGHVPGDRT